MARGLADGVPQSFTSPLAQIYQPLVVDDAEPILEEHSGSPTQNRHYAAVQPVRRRLTSIQAAGHKRENSHPYMHRQMGSSSQGHLKRFPAVEGTQMLSESPPSGGSLPQQAFLIPTAAEVKEKEEDTGEDPAAVRLARRLEGLEARQERMEELLSRLVKTLESRVSDT